LVIGENPEDEIVRFNFFIDVKKYSKTYYDLVKISELYDLHN
jgi:hypothetical protein